MPLDPRTARAEGGAAIDLARYAEVLAYLRQFPADKKDEVIARLGVRRSAWDAAAARWKKAMDVELEAGKTDLASRYAGIFSRTRRRLEGLRPSLESIGPLPGPDDVAPSEAVPTVRASPALAPPEPEIVAPPPVQPAQPSYMLVEPRGDRTPWATYTPAPESWRVPAPPPAPPAPKRNTVAIPVFQPPPELKLPFEANQGAPDQAFARAIAHALEVQGPPQQLELPLIATVAGTPVTTGPALPFVPRTSAAGAAAQPLPAFTLRQYASLRVELHRYPEREAETLARYKVPADSLEALDEQWEARFDADPAVRAEFLEACMQYDAWLDARGAPQK